MNVVLLMGGISAEHSISIRSAATIQAALASTPHKTTVIGLSPEGLWLSGQFDELLERASSELVTIEKGAGEAVALTFDGDTASLRSLATGDIVLGQVDVVFPALHGPGGEDGSIQGLLESMRVAFVGAGSGASAIAMDKVAMKYLCRGAGIPQADFLDASALTSGAATKLVDESFGFPCFVKPSRMGSSLGISRVVNPEGLEAAFEHARRFDSRVVIEEAVDAREIEVAIMGAENPEISQAGEIVVDGGFYDFDAKYVSADVELIAPAELPAAAVDHMRAISRDVWKLIGCRGMARADFFVRRSDDRVLFNEVNTIPGFTSISMFPRLWQLAGLTMDEIVSRLIRLAAH